MKVLQLGLGPESVALYYMSCMGELPRMDYAIFPDLGNERHCTYGYIEKLRKWRINNHGIPIIRPSLVVPLSKQIPLNSGTIIPAFVSNNEGGVKMLRRECTGRLKVQLLNDCIEELSDGDTHDATEVWKAVPRNQLERMVNPTEKWKTHIYPFAGYKTGTETIKQHPEWMKTTNQILEWFVDKKLPIPATPSCTFCPYQPDFIWKQRKQYHPEEWNEAVQVDQSIGKAYLHESLQCITDVHFGDNLDWKSECSGNCHL